jgi:hypothetical protein
MATKTRTDLLEPTRWQRLALATKDSEGLFVSGILSAIFGVVAVVMICSFGFTRDGYGQSHHHLLWWLLVPFGVWGFLLALYLTSQRAYDEIEYHNLSPVEEARKTWRGLPPIDRAQMLPLMREMYAYSRIPSGQAEREVRRRKEALGAYAGQVRERERLREAARAEIEIEILRAGVDTVPTVEARMAALADGNAAAAEALSDLRAAFGKDPL